MSRVDAEIISRRPPRLRLARLCQARASQLLIKLDWQHLCVDCCFTIRAEFYHETTLSVPILISLGRTIRINFYIFIIVYTAFYNQVINTLLRSWHHYPFTIRVFAMFARSHNNHLATNRRLLLYPPISLRKTKPLN